MTQLLTNKDKFGKIDRMGRNYFALEFAEFLESDNFGGIMTEKISIFDVEISCIKAKEAMSRQSDS